VEGKSAFWGGAIAFWDSMKRAVLGHTAPALASPAPLSGELGAAQEPRWPPTSAAIVDMLMSDYSGPLDPLQYMTVLEFRHRLPELLLMRVDKICMASSLEARVPMLDIEMLELSFGFSQEAKIPGQKKKYLLREALRGIVPDDVLDRPKRGFGAPIKEWLRGPIGLAVRDRLATRALWSAGFLDREKCLALLDAHRSGKRDYSLYIWTIFNLAIWRDTFGT
jgi:asparagine synthase (glutamine-hydrolysing)